MAESAVIRSSPKGHSLTGQNGAGPQVRNNTNVLSDPDAQEREFSSVTEKINIPNDVNARALELWLNLLHTGKEEFQSDHKAWVVCCIYIAAMETKFKQKVDDDSDKRFQERPCVTLTQVLRVADMNIVTFYKNIRSVKNECTISEHVLTYLTNVERKFIVAAPLYNKFEKIYHEVFQNESDEFNNGVNPSNHQSNTSAKMKSCWCLFILAKSLLLQNCNELVLPFQLLLCCIDHAIRMSPTFLLKPPYDTAQVNHYATSVVSQSNSNSLRLLCEEFNCDHSEVITVLINYWQKFVQTIPQDKLHQGVDGLPELSFLTDRYREVYQVLGDFDEILFLEHDPHLLPANHRSSSQSNTSGQSGNRPGEMIPQTPVRTAMITVQALQSMLSQASDVTTPRLNRYFSNCPVNPFPEIERRIGKLQQEFIREFLAVTGPAYREIAKKRWQLALRLYYRVMEAMLKSEEDRLSMSDFSTLLHNDTFHKSLLAASIEVVMVTYSATWSASLAIQSEVSFPKILDVFDLKGFDFYKVLESFVKAEPRLTRDVIKHLQCVESQILESIAWQSDSPLFKFDAIKLATVAATSKIPETSVGNLSPPTTTAADMYLSPLNLRLQGGTASNHRHQTSLGNSPSKGPTANISNSGSTLLQAGDNKGQVTLPRSQTLNLFFNKVLKLAYNRLQTMCRALDVNTEVERYIWTTVEHCTINRPELLKDRHLDQIILCCIYGVSKAADSELKFKDIVAIYRKLYQSAQSVFKSVRIDGNEFDSIIGFYNRVFMPALKSYVLQFQPNRMKPMLSPIPAKCQNSLASPTVIRVPGRENFYVSPMKESPFKSPRPRNEFPSPSQMTPRSRTLYSFGDTLGGSSEKLQQINEAMRAVKRSAERNASKSQKRLKFEDSSDKEETSQQNNKCSSTTTNGIHHKDLTPTSREKTNNCRGTTDVLQRKLDAIASERRQVKENSQSTKTQS
ncbi:retinoblastoma-associated protein-like isoform X2 [Ptychodera flava]|uniref:retinoblastoma-associated protein-like isoform X2 n=1 Tax=Ptychodera flava TaxID=63121 RepID=UPI00396AADCB